MKSIYLQLFTICFLLLFSNCKKEAGKGGTAFIQGKVYAKYYDKTFYLLKDSAYAPDVDVYIIYGNEPSYGDHQKTSYDGTYQFKYLRNGSYTIYTYSQDTTGHYNFTINVNKALLPVTATVEITKSKQTVEVPDLKVIIK